MTYRKPLSAVVFALLAGLAIAQVDKTEQGIPDRDLGLSKTSVFEVTSPHRVVENQSSPGEEPLLPRVNPESPPATPHGVAEWLPITLISNMCVDCHEVEVKEEGEPTPIPASHFTDLRREPGKVGDKLAGARYNCIACHVSLTESKALVENRFAAPEGS
jgi:cytochrome c-type protein NapB